MHGDCLELMRDIPDGSVDVVLTDIPYGVVNRSSNGLRNLDKGAADECSIPICATMEHFIRIAKNSIYVFCGTEQVSEIRRRMIEHGLSTRLIIWEKTNPSPMNGQHIWLSGVECCVFGKRKGAPFNLHCENTVLRYPCGRNKLHPTQKPLDLITKLLIASTNKTDLVLDPFMGSGTTGVACANTGRRFIGIEKDDHWFEVARDRVEQAFNETGGDT